MNIEVLDAKATAYYHVSELLRSSDPVLAKHITDLGRNTQANRGLREVERQIEHHLERCVAWTVIDYADLGDISPERLVWTAYDRLWMTDKNGNKYLSTDQGASFQKIVPNIWTRIRRFWRRIWAKIRQ